MHTGTRLALGLTLLTSACTPEADEDEDLGVDTDCPDVDVSDSGWHELPQLPTARQGAAVVAFDSRIYVIGGDRSDEPTDVVEAYTPATGCWARMADLPAPGTRFNVAAVGDRIYVLGGSREGEARENAWAYDPATDAWDTSLSPIPDDTERAGAAVGVVGTTVYLAGGTNDVGGSWSDVIAYDTAGDTWRTDLPAWSGNEVEDAVGAVVDGTFYVIGGDQQGNFGTLGTTALVRAFDPELGAWEARAEMPLARHAAAGGVIDGRIHVVGGLYDSLIEIEGRREHLVYDPATDSWDDLQALPSPRFGMGGAVVGDMLFVAGGGLDPDGVRVTDAMESFTP